LAEQGGRLFRDCDPGDVLVGHPSPVLRRRLRGLAELDGAVLPGLQRIARSASS